jgi:acyl-CoA synthetase (NDP forming)
VEDVAAGIEAGIADAGEAAVRKPVVLCLMSSAPPPAVLGDSVRPLRRGALPVFRYPEPAAAALARAAEYAEWRERPIGVVPKLSGVDTAAARAVVEARPMVGEDGWLRPDDVERLLHAAGIESLASRQARTPEEAATVAEGLGLPVAVKAIGPSLLHKTELGGVRLQLASADAVRSACEEMQQRLGPAMELFLVQRMAPAGVEVLVGVTEDPIFGPLIGFGLGGTAVEVLRDIVFRITPLTDEDARGMVRAIRGLPLLQGFRGGPAVDLEAVEGLLLRVSWLVEEMPQVAELDLNPVIVAAGQPPRVVDARVRVRATA